MEPYFLRPNFIVLSLGVYLEECQRSICIHMSKAKIWQIIYNNLETVRDSMQVLITNMMSRWILLLMILNGVMTVCVILPNSEPLWQPIASNLLKIDPYCLRYKCSPKNLVLSVYDLRRYSIYPHLLHTKPYNIAMGKNSGTGRTRLQLLQPTHKTGK